MFLSIEYYLKKGMHESYKRAIKKKLSTVLKVICLPNLDEEKVPSIESCFQNLGVVVMRKKMLCELNKMIMDATSFHSSIQPWVDELYNLYNLSIREEETIENMIKSIIYHEEKEKEDESVISSESESIQA